MTNFKDKIDITRSVFSDHGFNSLVFNNISSVNALVCRTEEELSKSISQYVDFSFLVKQNRFATKKEEKEDIQQNILKGLKENYNRRLSFSNHKKLRGIGTKIDDPHFLEISISDDLYIQKRTKTELIKKGIIFIGFLPYLSRGDLVKIKNIGGGGIQSIERSLAFYKKELQQEEVESSTNSFIHAAFDDFNRNQIISQKRINNNNYKL